MSLIRIATRNSPLALWQANYVKEQLMEAHVNLEVDIVSMTTKGDQLLDRSLAAVGGKGLFLKELEISLLNNETDIAVHSMKDVPVSLPKGLEISVVCEREDARDAFVSNGYQNLYVLPRGAKVGTASLRRIAQLKKVFPTLEFIELRGNVNTRLKKLDNGDYDAIILAAAGLIRLGFVDRIKQYISPELSLPAVGQGIVGIECRSDDDDIKKLLQPLHSHESELCLAAERAMNAKLDGGCQVPIAGYAELVRGRIWFRGMVGKVDGSVMLNSEMKSPTVTQEAAIELGENVAKDLLEQGAGAILASFYSEPTKLKKLEKPVVILTRQKRYLGNTESILETLDFQVVHLPALVIKPQYEAKVLALFSRIEDFTDIIFVSRNAVEIGMSMITQQSGIPKNIRVMAVGAETAKQLHQYGVDALFPNIGSGADALLKVKQLSDLSGRKILVVRGSKGFDWPVGEIVRRGGEVELAECYLHEAPSDLEEEIASLLDKNHRIASIFVHSSQSTINFLSRLRPYYSKIKGVKLVVGSEQIAEAARSQGWANEILVAESPSNKHMMIRFST